MACPVVVSDRDLVLQTVKMELVHGQVPLGWGQVGQKDQSARPEAAIVQMGQVGAGHQLMTSDQITSLVVIMDFSRVSQSCALDLD